MRFTNQDNYMIFPIPNFLRLRPFTKHLESLNCQNVRIKCLCIIV